MTKRTCTIDGCDKEHRARGYCHSHYIAARRQGLDTLPTDHLHLISDADKVARTGTCSICGPVDLRGSLNLCGNKIREIARRRNATDETREWYRRYARSWKHSKPNGWAEQLLEEHGWMCDICQEPVTWSSSCIDHDHACCPPSRTQYCGECVRGVLCHPCNVFLGRLENRPLMTAAVEGYLNAYRSSRG